MNLKIYNVIFLIIHLALTKGQVVTYDENCVDLTPFCKLILKNSKNLYMCYRTNRDPSTSISRACCQTCFERIDQSRKANAHCLWGDRSTDCKIVEKFSGHCYRLESECCKTCGKLHRDGFPNCEYGDKDESCKEIAAKGLCWIQSYNQICCQSCHGFSSRDQKFDRFDSCPLGYYYRDKCRPCEIGFFQKRAGHYCERCPLSSTTLDVGSNSINKCFIPLNKPIIQNHSLRLKPFFNTSLIMFSSFMILITITLIVCLIHRRLSKSHTKDRVSQEKWSGQLTDTSVLDPLKRKSYPGSVNNTDARKESRGSLLATRLYNLDPDFAKFLSKTHFCQTRLENDLFDYSIINKQKNKSKYFSPTSDRLFISNNIDTK